MQEKLLVLSADPWRLVDEKTGEIRQGSSIWAVNDYRDTKEGLKPTKITISEELAEEVKNCIFPAVCVLHFGFKPGSQSKAALVVRKIEYIGALDFDQMLDCLIVPPKPDNHQKPAAVKAQ